ncbi:MAG: MogA/MoaB family molybdenum cofactor biosynthesis protein [Acidimicrobiales bacterium]
MTAAGLKARVLTVSDGVANGQRDDISGRGLVEALVAAGYTVDRHEVTADGAEAVAAALRDLCAGFAGLVITTGGTGFAPRDQTPEGTKAVLDREAPGLAEACRLVNPLGRLSRGVAGTRGEALVMNVPGSTKGALECLDSVADVLPHAIRLLLDAPTTH